MGGGLSALNALEAIRERDTTGSVVLITNEEFHPYDRVPLSKGYLTGRVKRESLFPKKADFFEKQNIRVMIGKRADALDPHARTVSLEDGAEFQFEKLLLATGGRPRKLSLPGSDLRGVYYLRTINDCDGIKTELMTAKRAVVVGGGFIGCELAAAFVGKGIDTTIVEASPSLLSLAFDSDTAKWIEGYFAGKGVKVITNSTATEFVGQEGRVMGIKTNAGVMVPGDIVVVGVGIIPNTELAESGGLAVEKGIVVDEFLETSVPGVFAVGDVARIYHPVFGHHIRVEHYDVAVKQGRHAGASMAGDRKPYTEMPYFFSYMFDLTVKAYGDMSRRETVVRRGDLGTKGFFQFFFADGRLQAFLSMNRPMEEIKIVKDVLLRHSGIEKIASISDESKDLREFVG